MLIYVNYPTEETIHNEEILSHSMSQLFNEEPISIYLCLDLQTSSMSFLDLNLK